MREFAEHDPTETSGEADDIDDAVSNNKRAYSVLMAKAEELRRRYPALSKAQAFSRVYLAPENAAIAKRERAQNRPRVG